MLFDLYFGGHHGQSIGYLVRYWLEHGLKGHLSIVVPPRFAEVHADVAAMVKGAGAATMSLVPLIGEDGRAPRGTMDLLRQDFRHGRLFARAVRESQADRGLLMYFDHAQLATSLGLRFRQDFEFSGVYFRPSFHYGRLAGDEEARPDGIREIRKKALLRLALRNRSLKHLFCMDPFAIPFINELSPGSPAVHLPDGLDSSPCLKSRSDIRRDWVDGENCTVALLFGSLELRKGVLEVLRACTRVRPDLQSRLCVVMAGRMMPDQRPAIMDELSRATTNSGVRIVLDERFIPPEELQDQVRASDLVLATYRRHIGSSNVLVRAAQAGIPVLGSDFGVVGEQIRRHRLGLAVESESESAIASALDLFIETPDAIPYDATAAAAFAAENTADRFSETILGRLGFLTSDNNPGASDE